MTLTNFCQQSSIPQSVIRAVVRQVGGWGSFREMAQDVANHGAGWSQMGRPMAQVFKLTGEVMQ